MGVDTGLWLHATPLHPNVAISDEAYLLAVRQRLRLDLVEPGTRCACRSDRAAGQRWCEVGLTAHVDHAH
eukprot:6996881-Prorocentrum_lima.AAC.1